MNPTTGRWWIVKVQPFWRITDEGWALTIHRLPSVGFAEVSTAFCSLDFNDPPTAIGGIRWKPNFQTRSQHFVDSQSFGFDDPSI
ncbi:MAG: hypothetical protein ACRD82_09600, partial [Blastocatellia bacterium]